MDIEKAKNLGKIAFFNGQPRLSSKDVQFFEYLNHTRNKTSIKIKLTKAWLSGWDEANNVDNSNPQSN
jgi:hypothetical protein